MTLAVLTLRAARPWLVGGAILFAVGVVAFLGRDRLRVVLALALSRVGRARARMGERRLHLAGQTALAVWFAYWALDLARSLARQGTPLGQDIRVYYRATHLWLQGGDPWAAFVQVGVRGHFAYAGSPATVIAFAPSAILSEDVFTGLWVALTAASAALIVRRLGLPIWWMLFAPTLEAIWSGNPQIVVFALLLAGSGRLGAVADTVAVALKVYAGIPLLGVRSIRRVLASASFTVVTFVLAPGLWIHYAQDFGSISARLATESSKGFSAFYFPLLLVPVALAIALMWRRDHRVAAWLAVPALWPSSEFHYSTFALPVMSPILAVLLVIRRQQLPPVAILIDIAWRLGGSFIQTRASAWLQQPGSQV